MSARPIQRERAEGGALIELCAGAWWAPYLVHIPNERKSAIESKILMGQGVKAGVPDYLLFLRAGEFVGLALELKAPRPHGRNPSAAQYAWLKHLTAEGWYGAICFGCEQAYATLRNYTARRRQPTAEARRV